MWSLLLSPNKFYVLLKKFYWWLWACFCRFHNKSSPNFVWNLNENMEINSLLFTIEINLHNLFLSQCSITYTPLRMLGNQKFSDVCRDIEMEQWFILGQTCFMIHDIHDHIMETYIQIWWLWRQFLVFQM